MLLLRTEKLPEGPEWIVELKLDGYRCLAFKTSGKVHLRSRTDNDFNGRYPGIVKALASMPDETVIDGEIVALDAEGRPSFNTLQNYGSSGAPLRFFIFNAAHYLTKGCLLVQEMGSTTPDIDRGASRSPSVSTTPRITPDAAIEYNYRGRRQFTGACHIKHTSKSRVVTFAVRVEHLRNCLPEINDKFGERT
jgi:hypothetical protein